MNTQLTNIYSSESNYTPTSSFNAFTASIASFTSSINTQIANVYASESNYTPTSSFNSYTSSANTQIANVYASHSNYTPTASFNAFTSSYNTGSFSGSFSGSFRGDGSGLTNISASSIVGLVLNQIASGSVTASVSPAYGFSVNASSSISGAFAVSSSGVAGAFKGSGSGMFTVDGTSGRLLTVDDTLTGTLLSVVDSSNLPILEVNSTHTAVVSGSLIVTGGVTGSLQGTASWALNAVSSSYTLSSSYAATSSFADNFLVAGTITAQRIVVQTISSSVIFSSGSNTFGNSLANQQIFTGSVHVTGSLDVNGSPVIVTSQTSSMVVLSSSYANNATSASYATVATSASYAANATTASYWSGSIATASYAFSSSQATSASYWSGSIATASYSLQSLSASLAQIAISASFATTAAYAMNGGGGGVSAIYISDEGALQGTASYFDFNGSGVTATVSNGTASITIPGATGGGGVVGQNAILNQTSPATTWSFSHNLGTLYPVFTIFDSSDNVIIPQQIHAETTNSALIYFSSPRAGHAVAALGGGIVSSSYAVSSSYSFSSTSASYALSSSYAVSSSKAVSSSYALSSSYAANADLLDGKDSSIFATTGSNVFNGTQTITGSNKLLIGSYPSTTTYPTASLIVSNVPFLSDVEDHNIGIVATGIADSINGSASKGWGVGVYGKGWTAGGIRSAGIIGEGMVSASTDAGSAIGVRGYSNQTHSGGANIGLYADVTGGLTNYALYMNRGDIASNAAQAWTLVSSTNALNIQSGLLNVDTSTNTISTTGRMTATSFTGSLFGTASNATSASYALNTTTASYSNSSTSASFASTASYWSGSINNVLSASYAATSSYSNAFTVGGTLTAQRLVVQTITSSVIYSSGSNVFGNDLANTQVLTGSVSITGSLAVNGSNAILSNQTSSMSVATASQATNVVGAANRILFNSATNTTTTSNNLTWEDSTNLMTLGSATGTAGTISKIALYTSSFGGYG